MVSRILTPRGCSHSAPPFLGCLFIYAYTTTHTCGCAGKTVKSLENTCHTWRNLSASAMVIHCEEALYQVYVPSPFDAAATNFTRWHMQRGLVLGGQPHPPRGNWIPALNFGVPLYLCVHTLSQNYDIWRGNTCRRGACILESATPTPPIPR